MDKREIAEVFDLMVGMACGHAVQEEVAGYVEIDTSDVIPSQEFEKKMQRLVTGAKRRQHLRTALRTALVAAVMIAALAGVAMAIPPVRERIINTWVEWTNHSADFHFSVDTEAASVKPQVPSMPEPSYIPEGYAEESRWEAAASIDVFYQNNNGDIITFSASPAEGSVLSIDSEHSIHSETVLNGIKVDIFTSIDAEYPSYVITLYQNFAFSIDGYVSTDILLDMLKSVF